jgi:dienelactone hydrolase
VVQWLAPLDYRNGPQETGQNRTLRRQISIERNVYCGYPSRFSVARHPQRRAASRRTSLFSGDDMCNRLIELGLLALAFAAFGTAPSGAGQEQLDGHWEGAITQPTGQLKIALDLRTRGDAVTGTFDLPAAAVFRWPLKVAYASPRVTVRLPNGMAFEGERRGDTISGTMPSPTGGHADPYYLKRHVAVPAPYREEEVSFQSGGFTLAATLRLPLAKGPHPALFLMQGSGAADRQAESFLADYLVRHGIATLVYDKRGTGSSGGDYRDESFNDFAADALAGIRLLQGRSEINPEQTGLYGRSHGGMVAPLAASLSKDVAFIINVSGAGVPPHQQMTYQLEAEMRRDGFPETDIKDAVAYHNQKWEVARTEGKGWDELQAATQNARDKKWLPRVQPATKLDDIVPSWKLQMGYDPMPALEGVKCPILAVFGELDTSTPVAQTMANYAKAIAKSGNAAYTVKVFPNADHALLVWPKPGDAAHWPELASGYLETMREWIHKRVGLPR